MNDLDRQSGLAPVNGASLYYEMAGDGVPLVLLHAGVADSRMWHGQFAGLAAHYRVIQYDMRGFGRSPMPPRSFSGHEDLAGLLDFLQAPQAIVVGVSDGGRIALDFALAYPQRVLALVLGTPSIGGAPASERMLAFWVEEETALEAGNIEEAVEVNLRLWVDGIYRRPEEVDPAVRQLVGEMQRQAFEQDIPAEAEERGLEPPAYGRVQAITAPTLVLVGNKDLPERIEQAQWLVSQIPQAQLATLPGVAHMLNMEAPQAFTQHVLDFLADVVEED